jgi:hypothetical protein
MGQDKQVKKFDDLPCSVGMLHYASGRNDFFIKPTECDGTKSVATKSIEDTPSKEDFQKMIDHDLLDILPGMLTHSSGRDGFSSVDYSPRFDLAQLERGIPINTAHKNSGSEEDDFRLLERELSQ